MRTKREQAAVRPRFIVDSEQAAGEVMQWSMDVLGGGHVRSTVPADQLELAAKEIEEQLIAGHGSVVRWAASVADLELWRTAARRAGRNLSIPVRTGISDEGDKVWVVDES